MDISNTTLEDVPDTKDPQTLLAVFEQKGRVSTRVGELNGGNGAGAAIPNWTRDQAQTLLACDLYLRDHTKPLRDPMAPPAVQGLSSLLRRLPPHSAYLPAEPPLPKPDGAARKSALDVSGD